MSENSPQIEVQIACEPESVPAAEWLERCALAALDGLDRPIVNIRVVGEEEGRALNRQWRDREQATNVLSFPASLPEGTGIKLLGDIVVCAPVIEREAMEQGKSLAHHFAHMLVHGILHLRGFDHMNDDQAEAMEAMEIEILDRLGVADPYANAAS